MVKTARMLVLTWACLCLALGGCRRAASNTTTNDSQTKSHPPRQLKPQDFASAEGRVISVNTPVGPSPVPGGAVPPGVAGNADEEALFEDKPAPGGAAATAPSEEVAAAEHLAAQAPRPRIEATATTSAAISGGAYTMDAMVGQVNGQAIYANLVFEPLADQLTALGRSLEGPVFMRRASELIAARLDQMVTDALILSEAQRDLTDAERSGLRAMIQRKREDLLRQWGQGSLALAEARLREETDKTLDETLEAFRQQQIVRRYLMQKLLPLINVTRRDVEQYYREHSEIYQPSRTRTVRLIRLDRAADADTVAAALASGKPFKEVASGRPNAYRPEEGGLWPDPIIGDEGLGGALGEALRDMTAGQHKGPIDFNKATWWLYVETEDRAQARSLREVQLDIEKELRQNRFRYLSQRYRQRLYDQGSFNEMEKMVTALLDVAVSRYDTPVQ